MISHRLLLLAAAVVLAGCSSPNQTYVSQHPELSPAHRQILTSGKIPEGTAVAGLTHEQVKLAMGGDADTFDRIDGEEAWIYRRRKVVATELTGDFGRTAHSSSRNTESLSAIDITGPQMDVVSKTTIFFTGDRATHAENGVEQPGSE